MDFRQEEQNKTIQERIGEKDLIQERMDKEGNKWQKIYFGGREHCRNRGEQFRNSAMPYQAQGSFIPNWPFGVSVRAQILGKSRAQGGSP